MRTLSSAEIDEAHNWCDRWCERCSLADRCAIGRSAAVASSQPAMVQVAIVLERALEMLDVEFAKQGLGIEEAGPPVVAGGTDELAKRALSWTHAGARWLETAPVGESRAVVGWYHTLVTTKVQRALSSQAVGTLDDAAGSAKVASLGLAAVVDALTLHCQRAPQDSAGLTLLVEACTLIEAVEERFPDHLSFRRPGFDP